MFCLQFDYWMLLKKMQKIILQNALNKRKNKSRLKSHPFKQLGTGTWGLIRAWELNYSGKYGTFKFKMGCNLSCFFKLCIGLLKFCAGALMLFGFLYCPNYTRLGGFVGKYGMK